MTNTFNAKQFLRTVTNQPGVYRMYDISKKVIYIGKAKNLKKRLTSYFRGQLSCRKTEALVKNIKDIDVTITHTETEALLLEYNYIKLHQPRYNVLFRDDKSYPFIFLSNNTHPRITFYRGAKHAQGYYFGPFPNTRAVKETLALLQKLFPIRQCEDRVYRHRSRPCLQYHIGHCLAPCVKGLVSDEDYLQQAEYVRLFLLGKNQEILNQLLKRMKLASQVLNFEEAARLRDQIQAIHKVMEKQFVYSDKQNLDVIAISFKAGIACIHVLFIRYGKMLGSRSYFPKVPADTELVEIVQTFVNQFYLQHKQMHMLPDGILLDFSLPDKNLLATSLSKQACKKIQIQTHSRGKHAHYLKLARTNATAALLTKLSQESIVHQRLTLLAEFLGIQKINRMECFDISHTMGEQTIASCVVFDMNGPQRAEYRLYNLYNDNITLGDDYGAIDQVLRHRYNKALEKKKIPDVVILDGGKGQLNIAKRVFEQLEVPWDTSRVIVLGIAKGKNHKTGLETLYLEPHGEGITLSSDSPALHVIQHIRDDSHDYAIKGHRNKRAKIKNTSFLESIKGIGPRRRQLLLKHMGGLQPLQQASIEEIAQVPGISDTLAEKIFNALK